MTDIPTEISDAQKDRIAYAGIALHKALIDAYGETKATELYMKIDEVLGDCQGLAFLKLLLGETGSIVYINCPGRMVNKISVIKAIRTCGTGPAPQSTNFYGYGLKEAKDLADSWEYSGSKWFDFECTDAASAIKFREIMRDANVKVQ